MCLMLWFVIVFADVRHRLGWRTDGKGAIWTDTDDRRPTTHVSYLSNEDQEARGEEKWVKGSSTVETSVQTGPSFFHRRVCKLLWMDRLHCEGEPINPNRSNRLVKRRLAFPSGYHNSVGFLHHGEPSFNYLTLCNIAFNMQKEQLNTIVKSRWTSLENRLIRSAQESISSTS